MGEVPGSAKRFSIAVPLKAGSQTVCVFECAIDALSYLTILKMRGQDWHKANCLSLAGIYRPGKGGRFRVPAALEQYLKDNPAICDEIAEKVREHYGLKADATAAAEKEE